MLRSSIVLIFCIAVTFVLVPRPASNIGSVSRQSVAAVISLGLIRNCAEQNAKRSGFHYGLDTLARLCLGSPSVVSEAR